MGSIASGLSAATRLIGFGNIIKSQRESLGLTQKDLGFSVGCSDGYIAHIESEAKVPSLEICMALAQIFNMPSQKEEALLKAVENVRGEIAKAVMELLAPHLEAGVSRQLGPLVVGTVAGDLHDLGKNIFINYAKSAGFEVIDLGIDVSAEKFALAVDEHNPLALGMSCLLTITSEEVGKVIPRP